MQSLVELGKMHKSSSKYIYKVILLVKKDGSKRFCGDYRPLHALTKRDLFPMPLIDDVLDKLGEFAWFNYHPDLQYGFWQILMAPKNMKKTTVIIKLGLYEWNVIPFGLKNTTNIFLTTMAKVFKDWNNQFLKVFVDDVNIHNLN